MLIIVRETPRLLRNPTVPWRVCRGPPQVIIPCQIKPVNNIPRHFFNGSVNVIQRAPPASSPITLGKKTTNYEALRDFPQPPASPYLAYVLLAPNCSLKATVWSQYNYRAHKYKLYIRQQRHLARFVSTNKCAGNVTCT